MKQIINYDNCEYLEYAGTNNGSIYDFTEYTIGDDDEMVLVGERRLTRNEIRSFVNGCEVLDIIDEMNEIEEPTDDYDSFGVSAVFEDGTTVDNDIVRDTGKEAIVNEINVAREWFEDRNPESYMISYYLDGKIVGAVEVE